MTTSDGVVALDIIPELRGFAAMLVAGVTGATAEADRKAVIHPTVSAAGVKAGMTETERSIHTSVARAEKDFLGLRGYIGSVGKTIAGVFVADKIVGFLKDSTTAALAAQKVNVSLANSIAHNNLLGKDSQKIFEDQALSLERLTGTRHLDTLAADSQLATFRLSQAQITKLTPLVVDLSEKFGISMPMAARLLGRAASGAGAALGRTGIVIDKARYKLDPFGATVDAVTRKAGGFGEVFGKTVPGKLAIASAETDTFKEKLGAAFLPVLSKLTGYLITDVLPAIQSLGAFLARNKAIIEPLAFALGILGTAIYTVSKAVKIYTEVQKILNLVLAANPIGLVITALGLLAVGLVYAYTHSKTFRDFVKGAFAEVAAAGKAMWYDVLRPALKLLVDTWFLVVGALVDGAAAAFGWVPGLGGKLKAAAKTFDTFRDDVNKALSGISGKTVTINAQLALGQATGTAANAGTGGVSNTNRLLKATGGPVSGPGTGTSDSIPAMLSTGEHVWTAEEVRKAGGHTVIEALRRLVRGYATGGPVGLDVRAITAGIPETVAAIMGKVTSYANANVSSLLGAGGSAAAVGAAVGGAVSRWAGLVAQVVAMLHQPLSAIAAVLRRINFESGGNPAAINLTDINALQGHPSRGLMQVVPSTFAAYAGAFASRGIDDPLANIYAGANYAVSRYGSLAAIDPLVRPVGYDSGGMLPPGDTWVRNSTGKPEVVLAPGQAGNHYHATLVQQAPVSEAQATHIFRLLEARHG